MEFVSGTKIGPVLCLDTTVAAGADKTGSAVCIAGMSKGCCSLTVTGASGASAGGALKLQGSLDGSTGWFDTSTNHAVTVGSNDWNSASTTNTFSWGFGFADVNAPHIRLYLDAGTGMAGTIQAKLYAEP